MEDESLKWFTQKKLLIRVLSKEYEKKNEAKKSERRMPRLRTARKDVVSCEKLRGAANRL